MDNKNPLNKSNNFDYDTLNQSILEQAILLKTTSEIRALKFGIIPEMEIVKKIHLIEEPKWNEVRQTQVINRIFRK
jgi:hypothetical protein